MSKTGIANVRMIITEEKIISNIEKIQKLINPNSKKQIVELEDDPYFKDLIESIKNYLIEYPKKKNFPNSVYKSAYGLVEYATNQFEENTKKIEELIIQREKNIAEAEELREIVEKVSNKQDGWKDEIAKAEEKFGEDVAETLKTLGRCRTKTSENYKNSMKLLNARINNLEANLHIEIDMDRIEDRSKALSFIGIEIADALKTIPTPKETIEEIKEERQQEIEQKIALGQPQEIKKEEQEQQDIKQEIVVQGPQKLNSENTLEIASKKEKKRQAEMQRQYRENTTFEVRPSLWEKIKNTKIARAIKYLTRIRIVVQLPALPEGNKNNKSY